MIKDCYLGDGVYASFDGYGIVLDLREQDNTTRIVLEPEVFAALVQYRKHVNAALAEESAREMEAAKRALHAAHPQPPTGGE